MSRESSSPFPDELPSIRTAVPGPLSRELARELRRYESPNITYVDGEFPIFWETACGAVVEDVDGNRFLDLSSAFGVAGIGHRHPRVVKAIQQQSERLLHGMGDVHPSRLKVELESKLGEIAPGNLRQVIPGTNGADAVEAALKTAVMATGRTGVLAFQGGYHGLSYGALAVNGRSEFRAPFQAQIAPFVNFLPYPDPTNPPDGMTPENCGDLCLEAVKQQLLRSSRAAVEIGAVIVEPIQGRGGVIIPPKGWFRALRDLCHRHGVLLISDEIFTGFGRTGSMFASETPPDILCVGKILGGGLPISACIGAPEVMACWGESTGEALHTSTFLGHPLAAAAALETLKILKDENMVERSRLLGAELLQRLQAMAARIPGVQQVRGKGMMIALSLTSADGSPDGDRAIRAVKEALRRGLILLPAGPNGNILELVPPFIIGERQLAYAVEALEEGLQASSLV